MINPRLPIVLAVAIAALAAPGVGAESQSTENGASAPQRPTGYVPLDRWRAMQSAIRHGSAADVPQAPPETDSSIADNDGDRTQQVISRLHHLGGRKIDSPSVDPSRSPISRSYLPLQNWNASQAQVRQGVSTNQRATEETARGKPQPARNGPQLVSQTAIPAGSRVVFRGERLPETEPGRSPGSRTRAETVDAPPAIAAPENEYFIDLDTVIRLVASGNPTLAIAREEVREVLALQMRANSMLLPSLNAGAAYHAHQGNFQASTGQIKYIYSKSLYYGGGTRAWAAEAPAVPMVRLFSHLGDAIFEPLSVRQQVASRRFNSTATANTILLEAVMRYFDLLGAEGRLQAARETERETAEIVRITASYAVTGQGREGDANRARAEAYLMHTEVQRAEEREALAAAKLGEILSLEPTVRLHTVGGPIGGLQIVDPDTDLQTLIRTAERRRPELAAGSANIQHNMTRLRQEKARPLFPMVMVGYSAASFGGGSVLFPPFFSTFRGRQDFDALAVWSLTNLGVGNAATVSERRAVLNQSIAERTRALNGVRQEVIAAYGLVQGERLQIQITQRQLADTEEGFREEFRRLLGAEALPIEVLNSVDQLGVARQELIKAVTGYNQAQFRLFVATGMSPTRAVQSANAGKKPSGPDFRQPWKPDA